MFLNAHKMDSVINEVLQSGKFERKIHKTAFRTIML